MAREWSHRSRGQGKGGHARRGHGAIQGSRTTPCRTSTRPSACTCNNNNNDNDNNNNNNNRPFEYDSRVPQCGLVWFGVGRRERRAAKQRTHVQLCFAPVAAALRGSPSPSLASVLALRLDGAEEVAQAQLACLCRDARQETRGVTHFSTTYHTREH